MNVLVTGGAGFIGSHLVDSLVKRGHKVLVVDNLSTGHGRNVNPKCLVDLMDLSDTRLHSLISSFRPKAVFHLAGQVSVSDSFENPNDTIRQNVVNTLRLMQHSADLAVQYFGFASSSAVYGEFGINQTEQDQTNPSSPYGLSKLMVDQALAYHMRRGSFIGTSLRFANVYGPRQIGGVVPLFIKKALNGQPLSVHAGNPTRDFVYVSDVVSAMTHCFDNQIGGIVNVGTGIETSVTDVADLVIEIANSSSDKVESPIAIGQIRSCLDITKAKQSGWSPSVEIRDGLSKTIEWYNS